MTKCSPLYCDRYLSRIRYLSIATTFPWKTKDGRCFAIPLNEEKFGSILISQ